MQSKYVVDASTSFMKDVWDFGEYCLRKSCILCYLSSLNSTFHFCWDSLLQPPSAPKKKTEKKKLYLLLWAFDLIYELSIQGFDTVGFAVLGHYLTPTVKSWKMACI